MKWYIYYFFHLLLQSRYRPVIYLLIYILILYLLNWSMADCMNNGSDLPLIAEAKPMLSQQGLSLKKSIIDYADEMGILQKTIAEQKLSLDTLKQQIQGYKKAEGLIFECCSDEVFNGLYRYKRSDTGEPCINYLNRIYRSHGLEPPFEDL